ncbi:MAG: hypothetical protein JSS89_06890 [Bacteroidetes bacterium]|nr:hypothetical protein [Bacteroidota bacterium]
MTLACTILLVGSVVVHSQQLGDLFGRSLLLTDGGLAGTTKNRITVVPSGAATLATDYTLIFPSTVAPASSFLSVSSITGTQITLGWTSLPTATSPYEEATSGVFNIRRITSLISGTQVTPGTYATDLQSAHSAASQTASANYSVIAGGRNNTNSGLNAGILSGDGTTVSAANAAMLGGVSNTIGASGSQSFIGSGGTITVNAPLSAVVCGQSHSITGSGLSFIGGGANNSISGSTNVIFGGQNNSVNSGRFSVIGGGSVNAISVDSSVILGGLSNTISAGPLSSIVGGNVNTISGSGSNAGILGGESNSITGARSFVIGGRNTTITGSDVAAYNGGSAITIAASSAVVLSNVHVMLANNTSTPSQARFFEPQATSGAFPDVSTNYVGVVAPASLSNDNTYTLPSSIGSAGQALRVAPAPAPTATTGTLGWVSITTPTVVTQLVVADNTAVTVSGTTSFLRLDGNGVPATRTVTLANGTSDGQLMVIRGVAFGANGVELQDAGNLRLSGDSQLNNNDTLCLIWDATSAVWVEVSRTNN